MHPVVFSREWFDHHQRTILWLLNAPLIGRWFRWVLCIRTHDVGYRGRIVQILPHAYIVASRGGSRTADFRTHAKYAKRLYYAFRPLWWTLHAWDQVIANPLVPALNAGFDTLTAYPDAGNPGTTTFDTNVARTGVAFSETWATLRAGAGVSGGGTGVDATSATARIGTVACSATTDEFSGIHRSIFTFATSSLGIADVSAATFSIYGFSVNDTLSGGIATVDVYLATPASNNTFTEADYQQVGTASQTGAPLLASAFSVSAYNNFTLSSLTGINKSGISAFGMRNANYDANNVAPTWGSNLTADVLAYFADQTGSANDPKLVVTYEAPSRLVPRNRLRPRVFAPGRAR